MKLTHLCEATLSQVPRKIPPIKGDGLEWNTRAASVNRARNMINMALNNTDGDVTRVMAVEDGFIVGAISYYTESDKWIIDRLGSISKGVGTQLIKHVITLARDKGAEYVELEPTDSSFSFYDALGFKSVKGSKFLLLAL